MNYYPAPGTTVAWIRPDSIIYGVVQKADSKITGHALVRHLSGRGTQLNYWVYIKALWPICGPTERYILSKIRSV
jgi:hypothetical protein